MNKIILNVQTACSFQFYKPTKKILKKWLNLILKHQTEKNEITIRIVEKKEIKQLNLKYRGKNKSTNILSFSYKKTYVNKIKQLGDLIICAEILMEEAKKQKKSLKSHWAHMIIHGTLHLLDYDHHTFITRKKMEHIETKLMILLNYSNPYIY